MKFFIDTAMIEEIREANQMGVLDGVTTNPSLVAKTGKGFKEVIQEILTEIPQEKIIWEAPNKVQQVWFIKLLGQNVNLGNITGDEVIALETTRIGIRGDTFDEFLK